MVKGTTDTCRCSHTRITGGSSSRVGEPEGGTVRRWGRHAWCAGPCIRGGRHHISGMGGESSEQLGAWCPLAVFSPRLHPSGSPTTMFCLKLNFWGRCGMDYQNQVREGGTRMQRW
jgi:hypothetical protein